MKATLTLSNARILNVEEITILKGEGFDIRLDLEGASFSNLEWYTNNDPVLGIVVAENKLQASIGALEVGICNIVITAGDFKVAKTLKIIVVAEIPVEADTLGVEVGEPVQK
jgi:uncharacterized protein YunC (DUF1805 family)